MSNELKKIILGSGEMKIDGYLSVDLYNDKADIKADIITLDLPDNSIDEMLAFHVIEHLDFVGFEKAIKNWYRMLKPGGKLIIECPDLEYGCYAFLYNKNGSKWLPNFYGSQGGKGLYHLNGFTHQRLKHYSVKTGFSSFRIRNWKERRSKYLETLSVEFIK